MVGGGKTVSFHSSTSAAFLVALLLFFSSGEVFATPPPISHSKPQLLWPDTAEMVLETAPGVRSVRFYFLRPGFDQYQMRFMKPEGNGVFTYQFDTSTIDAPKLYYYFEVRTDEGVFPYPDDAPLTPMMIEDDREGLELKLLEVPAKIEEEEAISTGTITVNGTVEYSLSRDKTVKDTSTTDETEGEGWESSLDAGEETEDTSRFADDDFLADFNVRLAKTWEKGETSISFDTNLTYTSHPLEGEQEGGISSILLEAKHTHHQIRIGDLDVVGSELAGDSLNTRGLGYQYSRGRVTSEVYYLNSRQSTVVEDSLPDADNYVAGAKLGVDVIEDHFHVDFHYFKGNDDSSIATYSSGYDTEILDGEFFSIAPRISFFDKALSFVGEYAETRSTKEIVPAEDEEADSFSYSYGEEEADDESGELKDSAYRVGVEVEKGSWKVSAFHKNIGPDFRSLFNLNELYYRIDRRGYDLNVEYFSEKFDVLVTWEDAEDNLDDDPDKDWSRYQTVSITPVWRVTDSLSLSVGHTNGQERSYEDEDRKNRLSDQDIVGYSAGIDFSFSDNGAVQLTWNIDDSESFVSPESDSVTKTVTFNFSYYDERLQFYPGISYSQTDTETELTETMNIYISGEYYIMPEVLSLSTNDSFTWTKGEETARTRMMLLNANLNWHLGWIHGAFSDTVFSIVGEYEEDRQEDSTTESYTVSSKMDFMF